MQVLILAGGKGRRLQPYTTVMPKPLMPVGDHPILEIIVRQLRHYGVKEIIIGAGYMSHLFQAFFGDGERFGLTIGYSFEEKPLGTAGAIGLAFDRLDDHFLVMNGDLLTSLNYRNIFEFHKEKGGAATIGLFERSVDIDFGVIKADDHGELVDYIEKPVYDFTVSMGVNVFNRKILNYIAKNEYIDMPQMILTLKDNGEKVQRYLFDGYWLDIGRIDDYETARSLNPAFAKVPDNNLARFYGARGQQLREQGDVSGALTAYEAAMAVADDPAEYQVALSAIYRQTDDFVQVFRTAPRRHTVTNLILAGLDEHTLNWGISMHRRTMMSKRLRPT